MRNQRSFRSMTTAFAILVAALLVGAAGLSTGNNGFVAAGAIFLLVAIILGVNQFFGRK